MTIELRAPLRALGERREPREYQAGDAIGRGRRRVLDRLGAGGELCRTVRRRAVEVAGDGVGVRPAPGPQPVISAIEAPRVPRGCAADEEGRRGLPGATRPAGAGETAREL